MARAQPSPPDAGSGPPGIDPWEARSVPVALFLLALLLIQGLIFIGEASQTSDEAVHLAAGYSYLTTGDFRLNPEHPPLIKEWAALPLLPLDLAFPGGLLWEQAEEWNIGRLFVHENRFPNDTLLLLGRLPILALSLLLGWFLFRWGRALFGARGALLGLALYVLDPNVVAHSSLVTTDLGVTLFMFLTVYALWAWTERPSPRGLALCGAMAGGAFASKFTSFWLAPIFGALLVGLLLLQAAWAHAVLWAANRVAAGTLDSSSLVLAIYAPAALGGLALGVHIARRALTAFWPATGWPDTERPDWARRFTATPARYEWAALLLGGIGGVLALVAAPASVLGPATGRLAVYVAYAPAFLLGYSLSLVGLLITVRWLRQIARIHREAEAIDPFDRAPLYAFSRVTAVIGLSYAR